MRRAEARHNLTLAERVRVINGPRKSAQDWREQFNIERHISGLPPISAHGVAKFMGFLNRAGLSV